MLFFITDQSVSYTSNYKTSALLQGQGFRHHAEPFFCGFGLGPKPQCPASPRIQTPDPFFRGFDLEPKPEQLREKCSAVDPLSE